MMVEIRQAFFIVWLILSGVACLVLVAPFVLKDGWLYALAPECVQQATHGLPCPLCGMTRGFVLISEGRFSEAVAANQHALFVYAAFLFDTVLCSAVVVKDLVYDRGRKFASIRTLP